MLLFFFQQSNILWILTLLNSEITMSVKSSLINLGVMNSSPDTLNLVRNLKTIIKAVKVHAEAEADRLETEEKRFLGIVYSGSLFEDMTDNIFYSVTVGRTGANDDFYASVRFVHNATQLYTGLVVEPAQVQKPGTKTGEYDFACMNNVTFPLWLTHLLNQSVTKLNGELAVDFKTLENVSLLEVSKYHSRNV